MSCRAIPSAQPDKRDLLVAYLEGEFQDQGALAEMFGGESNSFRDADFEEIARPVLEMLDGKATVNPNLNLRLLSFCPVDEAKKQISLNRCLRVRDVVQCGAKLAGGRERCAKYRSGFMTERPGSRSFAPTPRLVRLSCRLS